MIDLTSNRYNRKGQENSDTKNDNFRRSNDDNLEDTVKIYHIDLSNKNGAKFYRSSDKYGYYNKYPDSRRYASELLDDDSGVDYPGSFRKMRTNKTDKECFNESDCGLDDFICNFEYGEFGSCQACPTHCLKADFINFRAYGSCCYVCRNAGGCDRKFW